MKQEKQQEIALMRYGAIAPSWQDLMNVIQTRPLFTQKSLQKDLRDRMESSIIMLPPPLKNGIWTTRNTVLTVSSRKAARMPV